MSILVDGYNYIGRSEELRLDDPKARDKVIYLMGQYCARAKKSLTIVFDGNHFVHHVNRKRRYGRVTVIYTSPIYTADDAIKKMVRKQPPRQRKSMLVVTSDADILEYAKGHGTEVAKSEDFERTVYETLDAPKKIDRVNVRLSEAEVQEWLELFGHRAPDGARREQASGVSTSDQTSALPAARQKAQNAAPERKKTPMAQKKRLHKARHSQYTPKVAKREGGIDRENVRLSPSEVDEWMRIFGADEEDDE
jgi:predicted RNA-binding protein with PIN domain